MVWTSFRNTLHRSSTRRCRSHVMKTDYIILMSAGPAGSTAARYAAAGGAKVLMLEKDRDVGYPVRCGEAVSHEGVAQFIQPDPKWIASPVTKFRLIAPNGSSVLPKLDGGGYVLERRIFDYELAKLAADAGAEVITKAYVYDLLRESGVITGVRALIKDQKMDIRCKIVIAADGVESRVGKWAGMDTTCHIKDMESCAQMTLSGIEVEEDVLDFYFGEQVSPGGYLWVFPKGKNTANVGLGLSVDEAKKKSAIRFLHEFVERKYPNAAMLTHIAGGVPSCKDESRDRERECHPRRRCGPSGESCLRRRHHLRDDRRNDRRTGRC